MVESSVRQKEGQGTILPTCRNKNQMELCELDTSWNPRVVIESREECEGWNLP